MTPSEAVGSSSASSASMTTPRLSAEARSRAADIGAGAGFPGLPLAVAAVPPLLGHLQNGVDRLLFGRVDERARVDHDRVGSVCVGNQRPPGLAETRVTDSPEKQVVRLGRLAVDVPLPDGVKAAVVSEVPSD